MGSTGQVHLQVLRYWWLDLATKTLCPTSIALLLLYTEAFVLVSSFL